MQRLHEDATFFSDTIPWNCAIVNVPKASIRIKVYIKKYIIFFIILDNSSVHSKCTDFKFQAGVSRCSSRNVRKDIQSVAMDTESTQIFHSLNRKRPSGPVLRVVSMGCFLFFCSPNARRSVPCTVSEAHFS